MNQKLLLKKKVNISAEHIKFMSFIHPEFEYISDLECYENPMPNGIIYIGEYYDDLPKKLNSITDKWIIINRHSFDVDISTNEGLVKNLLPINYSLLNKSSSAESLAILKGMNYEALLEKVKECLISNSFLTLEDKSSNSVYDLYLSILSTPDCLNSQFFYLVNKQNVKAITSSVLTFLNLVNDNNARNKKPGYATLIMQSHLKYGKYIKPAICRFIRSRANKEISLYKLLADLNKAR